MFFRIDHNFSFNIGSIFPVCTTSCFTMETHVLFHADKRYVLETIFRKICIDALNTRKRLLTFFSVKTHKIEERW